MKIMILSFGAKIQTFSFFHLLTFQKFEFSRQKWSKLHLTVMILNFGVKIQTFLRFFHLLIFQIFEFSRQNWQNSDLCQNDENLLKYKKFEFSRQKFGF